MNVELLLQELSSISKKYELINQKTGGYFNIFEITNIWSDEVIICRVLHEILSPEGTHFQGHKYLKTFIKDVLRIEMPETELGTAKVFREYRIDNNRRIDLAIQTINYFIPIEVKIFSGEQAKQCFDYAQVAKNSKVYYLTRFGECPSEYSAKGLLKSDDGYLEVSCISFSEDILNWLESCVSQTETIKIAPIREVLLQFMMIIRKFTNQMEDEKEMEILDVLMKTPENMKSAIAIQNCVDQARLSLMKKMFAKIEEKIGRTKLENEYDYAFNEFKKCNDFYKYKYSTYPGISYEYRSKVKPNVDIWVRIEIDNHIFVGYCCPVDGNSRKQALTEDEITKILGVEPYIDNWWAYWEYAPEDNDALSPDFKGANDPYLQLFDERDLEEFTTKCADKVIELLDR
ncbi:PD-(D/E)XK nuclease family protein [Clostridiaceae bacterium 35-E11]